MPFSLKRQTSFIFLAFFVSTSAMAQEQKCWTLFSTLAKTLFRQTKESIAKAVDPIDDDIVAAISSRALTSENIEQSRLRAQQMQNQKLFRPLSRTRYSELLGHLAFLNKAQKNQQTLPRQIRRGLISNDPETQASALGDLMLLDQRARVEIVEDLLEHANPELRKIGRQALLAMGFRTNYTQSMVNDLKRDIQEDRNSAKSRYRLELHSLSDEQFLSVMGEGSPSHQQLLGRSLTLWQHFERLSGVPEEQIQKKTRVYQEELLRAKELLASDDPAIRLQAIDFLEDSKYVTQEVLDLLHRIIEKEPITEIRIAASRGLNSFETIPSAYLFGSSNSQMKQTANHAVIKALDEVIRGVYPLHRDNPINSPRTRWLGSNKESSDSRVDRALVAYTFARHVYSIPESETSRFLFASKPKEGVHLAQQRIQWESSVPFGYDVLETITDPKTGFKAAVYEEEGGAYLRSKIYAFGGSQTAKDIWADLSLGRVQVDSPHFQRLVDEAARDIEMGKNILVTGHSLGGGLAQAFSFYVSKRAKEVRELARKKSEREKTYFAPNPYGEVAVVTWMGLGGASIVRMDPKYSKKDVFEAKGLNKNTIPEGKEKIPVHIENYRLPGEPVSMVGDFLGELFDIGQSRAILPSIGKHFLMSSVAPAFVKNGLEQAVPSKRIQIPNFIVNGIGRYLAPLVERKFERDLSRNWKPYLESLLQARLYFEREFGYQKGIKPDPSSQTHWLHREIHEILDAVPKDSLVEAGLMVHRVEEAINELRNQKRQSPFK